MPWVSMLKAYVLYAHFQGREALESMTGGVYDILLTADVVDENMFWTQNLMKSKQDFLFAVMRLSSEADGSRKGVHCNHGYSLLEVREIGTSRLIKLRCVWTACLIYQSKR